MPRVILVSVLLVAALAAACGGGSTGTGAEGAAIVETAEAITTSDTPAPAGSIRALLAETPGEDVAIVFGSVDFAAGENRVTFLVLRSSGELVAASRARVYAARGDLDSKPTIEGTAENLLVGATEKLGGADDLDVPSVWVTYLTLDQPGRYVLLVEPEGEQIQAVGQIEVQEETAAPAVGSTAPPSDNPTLADGFPEDITTATPPDVELLRYSVKESIEDRVPFVVVFATPKFCQSRVCGPVVDVVDKVRLGLGDSGVRFIHVEIYEGNDPSKGFNRWVQEWNLPTEPYTFLVDGDGIVRAKFEGLVTVGELEEAVRTRLL